MLPPAANSAASASSSLWCFHAKLPAKLSSSSLVTCFFDSLDPKLLSRPPIVLLGELAELKAREGRLEAELQRRQLERQSRQEQRSQRRQELLEEVAQQEAS